jgi:hypothetical protein
MSEKKEHAEDQHNLSPQSETHLEASPHDDDHGHRTQQ